MDRSFKIFVSCALGAFIGSLVALQSNQYLWWVGLIIGGLAGYLSYEFKAVCQAVVSVWQAVASVQWKRKREEYAENFFNAFNFMMSLVFWALPLAFIFVFFSENRYSDSEIALWRSFCIISETYLFMLVFFFFLSVLFVFFEDQSPFKEEKREFYSVEKVLLFYFFLPKWILLGVKFLLVRVLFASIPFILPFLRRFFFLIHSQERLLCAFDAALGAGIGYLCGNPFVGALCGGILGVANFEIVSRRILKLVP